MRPHFWGVKSERLVDPYEAGAREWNPLTSGRTKIEFHRFYGQQELDDEFDNEFDLETLGLTLGLVHDNTDGSRNPSILPSRLLTRILPAEGSVPRGLCQYRPPKRGCRDGRTAPIDGKSWFTERRTVHVIEPKRD